MNSSSFVLWFERVTRADVGRVGGKNASLGEMVQRLATVGIHVPVGFATTADAYRHFIRENGLEALILATIGEFRRGALPLESAGESIRQAIRKGAMPQDLDQQIREAYRHLGRRYARDAVDVAVRSSATAEDLPEASFAGQQESFLNIMGEDAVLEACRDCFASLFTDRAISYREQQGFGELDVALSVGIQKMVRSDQAGAGVIFTLDTDTGWPDVVVISASWGLGEAVVKGLVTPDEYRVFKPLLSDPQRHPIIGRSLGEKAKTIIYGSGGHATATIETPADRRAAWVLDGSEVLQLARWACTIEGHYGQPMDIEWAKDGETGEIFIVQARPETVQSRRAASHLKTFALKEKGTVLAEGQAIGSAIAAGKVFRIIDIEDSARFEPGGILVTDRTDPDWVPLMKQAAGIVTDHGGRTSHAAIVSRELGVPAVVGTGSGTNNIQDGQEITLSCAEGNTGRIYDGRLRFEESDVDLTDLPATRTRIMMNVASPDVASRWWSIPADGVGLARMEFVINNIIKIHPLALTRFDQLQDASVRHDVERITTGYSDRTQYFVDQLAQGLATIAAVRYPKPVVVRLSDFKTNEYADLIGGRQFEPHEENPMLGFRGASRYYSDAYRDGFALECRAIKQAREIIGLDNIVVMVPFCRTPEEADRVLAVMSDNGLRRGEDGFQVYVMAEIPSNIILAADFAERFDGFSIGSNDLTQLVLGVDRDSAQLAPLFDERHPAVTTMIRQLIHMAHKHRRPVGICGEAPSNYPEFAELLVEAGIDSISVNPDRLISVRRHVAEIEQRQILACSAAATA